MIQHRKVRRAFTGLVGLPPEPDETTAAPAPAPVAAPEPTVIAKLGRPTKGDEVMTPAERQRQSRARKRQTETAPERQQLITNIVRRIKTSEHANIEMMQRALDAFRDSLNRFTLEHLRDIAKTYDIHHDLKGRSSLEGHTGTKLVAGEFIDRIGRISAESETLHLYGGQSSSTNVDDKVPKMREEDVTVWDLLPQISERMFEGEETDALWDTNNSVLFHDLALRCKGCDYRVATWLDARRHTEDALKSAEKQTVYVQDLQALAEKSGDDTLLVAARLRYRTENWKHHGIARIVVRDFRDSAKKARKRR
jgi:hypothetical protein